MPTAPSRARSTSRCSTRGSSRSASSSPGTGNAAIRRTIPSADQPDMPGMVKGFDVATGELLWEYKQPAPWLGGLVATGGGLLFGGDINRRFRALDQESGEVLWETILDSRYHGRRDQLRGRRAAVCRRGDGRRDFGLLRDVRAHPGRTAGSSHRGQHDVRLHASLAGDTSGSRLLAHRATHRLYVLVDGMDLVGRSGGRP